MCLYQGFVPFIFQEEEARFFMTRQSAASLRKLNSHLVHLAQEVEAKVNSSRKERELDLILDRQNQHVQTIEPS